MHKILISFLLVFSFQIFSASSIEFNLENATGQFDGSLVDVKADFVLIKTEQFDVNERKTKLTYSQKSKLLTFVNSKTEVHIQNDTSFLDALENFKFRDVNLNYDNTELVLDVPFLSVQGKNDWYEINTLRANSNLRGYGHRTIIDQLIRDGQLTVQRIDLGEGVKEQKGLVIPEVVSEVTATIKEGYFSAEGIAEAFFDVTCTFEGYIKSNSDNSELEIDLVSAKYGLFSMKGLILSTVENLNSNIASVKNEKIYIKLK